MRADSYPLQVLLFTVSGWVNRHQQNVIAYLVEENRVLEAQLQGRRLRLTDDQRWSGVVGALTVENEAVSNPLENRHSLSERRLYDTTTSRPTAGHI